jgi:hypothetical protein
MWRHMDIIHHKLLYASHKNLTWQHVMTDAYLVNHNQKVEFVNCTCLTFGISINGGKF